MVSFICNACGQTVKKAQVERHYQNECHSCSVLSCIDCGNDFHGNEYAGHTKCITEAEKYQGKLYKPKDKQNKGEQKQQQWLKNVKEATKSGVKDPRIAILLERISEYSNIPRKKAKFQNFCKNSINVRDNATLDKLWDVFSESTKQESQTSEQNSNGTVEHKKQKILEHNNGKAPSQEHDTVQSENTSKELGDKKEKRKRSRSEDWEVPEFGSGAKTQRKDNIQNQEDGKSNTKSSFKWKSVIKATLQKAPEHKLPIKRLRKKVLAEFLTRGANRKNLSKNELKALFEKKLSTNPIFKVHKDQVKLCAL